MLDCSSDQRTSMSAYQFDQRDKTERPNTVSLKSAVVAAVGIRIREARIKAGISQTELARRIGKSKQLVSSWESGRAEITLTTLLGVSEQLRVGLSWLLTGSTTSGINLRRLVPGTPIPSLTASEVIALTEGKLDLASISKWVHPYTPCSEGSFQIENPDDAMSPKFNQGEGLIFDPHAAAKPNAPVVCVVYADNGSELERPLLAFRHIRFRSTRLGEAPYELSPNNVGWPTITVTHESDAKLAGTLVAAVRTFD